MFACMLGKLYFSLDHAHMRYPCICMSSSCHNNYLEIIKFYMSIFTSPLSLGADVKKGCSSDLILKLKKLNPNLVLRIITAGTEIGVYLVICREC